MAVADGKMPTDGRGTTKVKKSKSRMRESEVDASQGAQPTPVTKKATQSESVGTEVSNKKKEKKEERKRKAKAVEEEANDGIQLENTGPKAAVSEVVQQRSEKPSKKDKPRKKRMKADDETLESHGQAGIAAAGPTSAADNSKPEVDRVNGNGGDSEPNGIAGSGNTKGDKASPQVSAIPTTWEQVGLPEPVQPAKKRKHEEVSGTIAKPKRHKLDRKKQKTVEPIEEHEEHPMGGGQVGSTTIPEVDNLVEPKDSEEKAQSNQEAKVDDAEETSSSHKDSADPAAAKKLKPKKSRTKTKPEPETNLATIYEHFNHTNEAPTATPNHQRFIVFVGNLPFTATTEQIKTHFSSVNPTSIRHLTVKNDPKARSKGYAFLEFDNYDRMKTCLKLYHHSSFPVVGGKGGKKVEGEEGKVRRINVELTVGGGGSKSALRKEKLQAKNERLSEQRKRRAEAEEEQGIRKARKDKRRQKAASAENGTAVLGVDGAVEIMEGAAEGEKSAKVDGGGAEMGDMHPSRRARMK